MEEVLFDLSAEYSQMLNQGIRLSGEDQEFFIQGRIQSLSLRLPADFRPRRILDFGCGIGTATRRLGEKFSAAAIVGVDTSESALEYGTGHYGSNRVHFRKLTELPGEDEFDLCYVNGVFHHIEPENRTGAVEAIYSALRPGGYLALFENNPWNPGTRLVMSRIPFDRNAIPLSIPEARRLVRTGGFHNRRQVGRFSIFHAPWRSCAAPRACCRIYRSARSIAC